ncbi:hypothetical protein EZS27_042818, partial [termite gut metagenome]
QQTDLSDVLEDLRISNFDFNCVAKLKKTLSFEGYKIIYKDSNEKKTFGKKLVATGISRLC